MRRVAKLTIADPGCIRGYPARITQLYLRSGYVTFSRCLDASGVRGVLALASFSAAKSQWK